MKHRLAAAVKVLGTIVVSVPAIGAAVIAGLSPATVGLVAILILGCLVLSIHTIVGEARRALRAEERTRARLELIDEIMFGPTHRDTPQSERSPQDR